VYSSDGSKIGSVNLQGGRESNDSSRVVAFDWYDGTLPSATQDSASQAASKKMTGVSQSSHDFCVAFGNGRLQISCGIDDLDNATVIDTGLGIIAVKVNSF
jgi:hypothetical protein